MLIRFIAHLAKQPKANETDEDYIDYKDQKIKHSYYNPSKAGCLLGIIAGLAIAWCGVFGMNKTGLFNFLNTKTETSRESKDFVDTYGHLISDNLEKTIPLHIVYDSGLYAIITVSSFDEFSIVENPDYKECVTVKLGEVVKEFFDDNFYYDGIIFTDQNDMIMFNKEDLKRIKGLKKYAKTCPANYALKLNNFSSRDLITQDLKNNKEKAVVISMPEYSHELIKIWEIDSFIKAYSQINPDSSISKDSTAEEFVGLFGEDNTIPGTRFLLTKLTDTKLLAWDFETGETGYLINYINGHSSGYSVTKISFNDSESEEE